MLPFAHKPLYFLKSNKVSDQPGMTLMGNPPRWHKMTPDMKGDKPVGHVVQDPHEVAAVNQLKNNPAFQKLSPDEQIKEVKASAKASKDSPDASFEGKIQSGKLPSLKDWQAFLALPMEKKANMIEEIKKDPQAAAYFEAAADNFKAMAAANIQSNKSTEPKDSKGYDLESAYLPESNVNAKTINKKLDAIQKLVDSNDIDGLEAMKFGVNGYNKKLAGIVKNIVEGLKAKETEPQQPVTDLKAKESEPKEDKEIPVVAPQEVAQKPTETEQDKAPDQDEVKAPTASQYEAIAAMIDAFYLPAANVNAKTANKKLDQMKELVLAGDTTSLGDLKFGVNTYGKKHQKLRDSLVSALEKGLDNPSAPNQDEKKHDLTLAEGSDDQGDSAKDIGKKPAETDDFEASSSSEEKSPKDGDTKEGADGTLIFKDGRWHKQGGDEAAAKIEKVWLNVPFTKKDVAKQSGAKWDAEKKLWYALPVAQGTGPHKISGALSSFVPDHKQVSSKKEGLSVAASNLSAETGKDYAVHSLTNGDTGETSYYVATPDGVASDDYTEKQISGWEKHGPVGGEIKSTAEVDKETGGAGSKFIDALLSGKTPDPELTTALGGFKSERYVELMQLAQNKWLKQQGLLNTEGADSLAASVLYDHTLGATHHEGDIKTADGKSFALKNNQWQPLSPQKDDPLVSKAKALNELNPHDLVHDLYAGKVSRIVDQQIQAVGKEAAGDFYQSFKTYQESPNYKNLVAAVCAAYGKPGMVLMATGRWVKVDEIGSSNDLLIEGSIDNVKKACLADTAYLLKDEPSSGPENPDDPQTFNNGTITFHGAATFNDLMQKKGWEVSDGAKPTIKFIKGKLDWSISPGQFIEDKAEWEKKKWYLKDLLPEGSAIIAPSGKNVISYDGNVMKFTNEHNVSVNDVVLDTAGVNYLLAGLWQSNPKIIPPGNPQLSAVGEAKEEPAESISEGKESSEGEAYKNPLDIPEAQNVLDMLASGFPPFTSDQAVVKTLSKNDQGEVLSEAAKKYAKNTDLNLSDADDMLFAADLMVDLFHGGDAPMEGDTKTKNGIVYQLINGKWHRITPKEKGDAAASHPTDAIQIPEDVIKNSKWSPSVKNNVISSLNTLKENAKTEGMAAFKGVLTNYPSKNKSIVKLKHSLGSISISVHDAYSEDSAFQQVKKCVEDLKAATQIASGKKAKKPSIKKTGTAGQVSQPQKKYTMGSATESIDNWKQVGPQGGYNPGGTYKDGDGVDWYCKFPKGGESVVKNELLALKLYKAAGIEVPEVKMVTQNGQLGLASRIVEGAKEDKDKLKKGEGKGLLDGFAVDAWLANWDVVGNNPAAGKGFDNILFKEDGSAVRIDAGGAILFGGAGSAKGEKFGDKVEDIQSMLDASKNANTAKVFGSMTEADIKASAEKVASIPNFRIESLVLRYGPGTYIERKKLLAKLLLRKNSIALQYGINQGVAKAEEVIEKPDPTKLKVEPKDLPAKPDYINGVGVQKSSHEKINELNQQSVDEMEASALKGNLVELKALEVHQVDKETGETTLKSAKDHPSKYAKDYFENLVSTMDTIANPSAKKMKDWVGRASKTVEDLSENFKAHLYGIAIKHLPANERLGFWISLGNATDYENLVPENQHWVTQKDKTKGAQSIQSMPKILKTWLAAVKNSGAYNQPYRDGDEIDGKNLNAREVLKAAYEHAVEFEEGTIIRKSIDFTKGSKGMLELMHGLPDGHVFQNPGSMCCSLKEGWNQSSWGGEAVLEMVYAKGAKGLYNIGIGSHDGEGEVTTLPGQRFMLLESAKEKDGMKNFFKVLVLPPDDLYVGEILNKEASDHDKSQLENAA